MFVNIGYFSMLAASALTIYAIIASLIGIKANNQNIISSVRRSSLAIFGFVSIAYGSLIYAFVTNDFSVNFVHQNSSVDLPLFYKITGTWGGMDGSLLFWEFILSGVIAIVAFRYVKTNREILPHTMVILNLTSLFILFLLVGWSNPLAQTFPAPWAGNGLNPLLQNPGMVFHPPFLYAGFIAFNVPFAFAIGSLIKGKFDNEWVLTTRRWTLAGWLSLTLGIIWGGEWAYLELGWGGYWAWDPVENASLMPWLTASAFLHSVQAQEKRDSLKVWNIFLIIATFVLSFLGTFITRSGVLNSVHSFAKSNIGPAFLVFIAISLVGSLALLVYRSSMLEDKTEGSSWISKERSFLLNNALFVGMAFTVLFGTMYPLIAEGFFNQKLSIQAPFFNTINTPLAFITIILMGITPFMAWKKANLSLMYKNLLLPFLVSLAIMPTAYFLFDSPPWRVYFLAALVYFAGHLTILELVRGYKAKSKAMARARGLDKPQRSSWMQPILKDRRRWGAMISHLGMVFLFTGFLGNFFVTEMVFSASKGETKQIGKYTLSFGDVTQTPKRNAILRAINVDVFVGGKQVTTLNPGKATYPTSDQPTTEVAIYNTILEDLYLSPTSFNEDGSVTINAFINPLVNLIWFATFLLIVGVVVSLTYRPAQLRKQTS